MTSYLFPRDIFSCLLCFVTYIKSCSQTEQSPKCLWRLPGIQPLHNMLINAFPLSFVSLWTSELFTRVGEEIHPQRSSLIILFFQVNKIHLDFWCLFICTDLLQHENSLYFLQIIGKPKNSHGLVDITRIFCWCHPVLCADFSLSTTKPQ